MAEARAGAVNSIEFAEKFTGELDKFLNQVQVTKRHVDSAFGAKFIGAKVVQIPSLDMIGLGDYDRDTGYAKGRVNVANTAYTLTHERSTEIEIDREDIDESGVASLAAEIAKQFEEEHVAPELDICVLSKLAQVAESKTHTITYNANDVLGVFDDMFIGFKKQSKGANLKTVCYVDYDSYGALIKAARAKGMLDIAHFESGGIQYELKTINKALIIPVDDSRMFTAYTELTGTGSDGKAQGGFSIPSSAKHIKMLMTSEDGISLIKKLAKIKIWSPDENQDKDAWKFQYRIYFDALIKKSRENVTFVSTVAQASSSSQTQDGGTGSN